MTRRICFALDLQPGVETVTVYERMHRAGAVPPAVNANLRAAGVHAMEIWRVADRLMMICEVSENFSGFGQAAADDPAIRQWDADMAALQRGIAGSGSTSWAEMTRVFDLGAQS